MSDSFGLSTPSTNYSSYSRPNYTGNTKRLRMADDREVLREIWDSKLPVSFTLAQEEIFTLNPPEPYYLMVPRLLYFPLIIDKVNCILK
jgi:hypothetical protein